MHRIIRVFLVVTAFYTIEFCQLAFAQEMVAELKVIPGEIPFGNDVQVFFNGIKVDTFSNTNKPMSYQVQLSATKNTITSKRRYWWGSEKSFSKDIIVGPGDEIDCKISLSHPLREVNIIQSEKHKTSDDLTSGISINANEDVIDKEVFTEPIDIVEGVVAEYTLERRYEHTITKTHMTGNEYGGSATASIGPKLFFASAELTAEVKAKTESSLGVTIGKSETYTQKITVDGDKTPKLKVTWVNRYRKCTATLPDGRRETYLVCVGVRWKLKKVENGK